VKQFQFFLNGDELEVAITIAAGFEPEVTRRETTRLLLDALRKLNVGNLHLNVRVVDAIARTGGGAKQKLVGMRKEAPKS
jgi:hypothetical protein